MTIPQLCSSLSQLVGRVASMCGDPTVIPPTGTGIWFMGKIEKLVYGHYGDLGFHA